MSNLCRGDFFIYKKAFLFLNSFNRHSAFSVPDYIGHLGGMVVHDAGPYDRPFVEGAIFNAEPWGLTDNQRSI